MRAENYVTDSIHSEFPQLRQGQQFKLKQSVEEAHVDGRDLLRDLSEQLDREIAQARDELKRQSDKVAP